MLQKSDAFFIAVGAPLKSLFADSGNDAAGSGESLTNERDHCRLPSFGAQMEESKAEVRLSNVSTDEKPEKASEILGRIKLENCSSIDEMQEQLDLIDYWIDEIQENAMNDVPIIILFCVKQSPLLDPSQMTIKEQDESDGSQDENCLHASEKTAEIGRMIL